MRRYQLAVMPGDGIGPEVIAESVETLTSVAMVDGGFDFDVPQFDWGTERYLRGGAMMPADGLMTLERGGFDGILLGPVGDPPVADQVTLWALLLTMRPAFHHDVILRPLRALAGDRSPLAD